MIGYPDGFSRPVILALYQMIADFIQSGLLDLMIQKCQLVASMVRNLDIALSDFVVNSSQFTIICLSNGLFFFERCSLITATVCAYKLNNAC